MWSNFVLFSALPLCTYTAVEITTSYVRRDAVGHGTRAGKVGRLGRTRQGRKGRLHVAIQDIRAGEVTMKERGMLGADQVAAKGDNVQDHSFLGTTCCCCFVFHGQPDACVGGREGGVRMDGRLLQILACCPFCKKSLRMTACHRGLASLARGGSVICRKQSKSRRLFGEPAHDRTQTGCGAAANCSDDLLLRYFLSHRLARTAVSTVLGFSCLSGSPPPAKAAKPRRV